MTSELNLQKLIWWWHCFGFKVVQSTRWPLDLLDDYRPYRLTWQLPFTCTHIRHWVRVEGISTVWWMSNGGFWPLTFPALFPWRFAITSCGVSQKISPFLATVLQVFLMESKDSDQLSITTNFDASKVQLLPRFVNQLQTYFCLFSSKPEISISVQKCQCPKATCIC